VPLRYLQLHTGDSALSRKSKQWEVLFKSSDVAMLSASSDSVIACFVLLLLLLQEPSQAVYWVGMGNAAAKQVYTLYPDTPLLALAYK
jgi:hypothetical protein